MSITSAEPTSPLVIDDAQLIGGRWVGACGGQTIDVINPATGQVLGRVPAATAPTWTWPWPRRSGPFPLGATPMRPRAARCSAAGPTSSTPTPPRSAGSNAWRSATRPGPAPMARILRFIAGQADKVSGLSLPTYSPDVLGLTLREPYGVVGSVIPWNAPGPMFVTDVGPAITAGNTIVIKLAAGRADPVRPG